MCIKLKKKNSSRTFIFHLNCLVETMSTTLPLGIARTALHLQLWRFSSTLLPDLSNNFPKESFCFSSISSCFLSVGVAWVRYRCLRDEKPSRLGTNPNNTGMEGLGIYITGAVLLLFLRLGILVFGPLLLGAPLSGMYVFFGSISAPCEPTNSIPDHRFNTARL